jgi:hypothetical protein
MRVYLCLFFLNSLIGLKLVQFICVVVLNFFMLCENLIKLIKFLIFFQIILQRNLNLLNVELLLRYHIIDNIFNMNEFHGIHSC